ncbi:hypothetical protein M5E86_14630 [Blautia wexlerae]|nr:hypothetical protein M5E86_14630 [Blautia wexlerae]
MLFVYECTGNIIADFKKFYDTQLSEQDKKKIFIPTYDCMKRYQGSWHVEQKPLFTNCFFIECRDKEELKTTLSRQHCSDSLAEAVMSGITPLRPEQEEFLKALMRPGYKDNLNVNRLHQRRHNPCDTGTPSGKREIYPQN